jgi:hypothetical protein
MSQIENKALRGRLRALPTPPVGGMGEPQAMRNLALTLLVIAPIIAIYLAIWKFWFTSDFLASLAASATQSTTAGSAMGLFEVVKPSDQLGMVSTNYFLGIPIYNTVVGSIIPYHAISFLYIGILGLTTWGRLNFHTSMRTILTRLWTFFGAIWFAVFAAAEFSTASIDAYITVGFIANIILAGFTACFLLVRALGKLRGGE